MSLLERTAAENDSIRRKCLHDGNFVPVSFGDSICQLSICAKAGAGGIDMRKAGKKAVLMTGFIFLMVAGSYGQSLGDVAREQRQKQAAKAANHPPKVITNEDIPESPEASSNEPSDNAEHETSSSHPASSGSKSAEQWQAQIQGQKSSIASLQNQIEKLNSSIHFAGPNCVANCVQYNERQVKKQDEVQRMQKQLEEEKKKLEDMQDSARKEGFGNSVYDP